jgi:molybdenum cofactor synthesis domain-containing protein
MRPFRKTITLDSARRIIARAIRPIDRTETVQLHRAAGRVLAKRVDAEADVPPFSRAAMDGYAVRAADTAGATRRKPRTLQPVATVYTGQVASRALTAGECIEIATGAPLPAGADAVVMVEETTIDQSGTVSILAPVAERQNVGRQGADIQTGQTVLQTGAFLNASRLGALAALGLTTVEVYAQPGVAILSTGNEIVAPGRPLGPGQIYDINRFTVSAVVAANGCVAVPYRTAADTLDDLSRAVDDCLERDVLVFSGGSSVGERDLVTDVITRKGDVLFHGVAVKPGKPTSFGRIGDRLVFGMPGYPTSGLSNAYILLAPALRQLARLPEPVAPSVRMPLGARVTSAPGRHQFYTVRIEKGAAMPAFKASGDITSMSLADGYIEIPAEVDVVEEGEPVEVRFF